MIPYTTPTYDLVIEGANLVGGYTPATYYGYDISNVQADNTVLVTTSGGGPTLYVKLNGSWVQVQRAYKKQNGSWSQVAVNQAFSSGTNYKQG